jgi:protease stability complex PrcB-like protein
MGLGRRHLRLIVVLVALAAVGGWLVWRNTRATAHRPIAWRDLTAALGPATFPRPYSHAFRHPASLVAALRTAMPGRGRTLPPIDFSRDEAFLVAAGPRSSTGYSLRVVSVVDTGHRVVVRIREVTPGLASRVTAGLTYPHRLIVFPRTREPVRAHWEGRP